MTPALLHLEVEVVALAGPLAHAAEDRLAAVALGHVVDQLHDHDRLAHAGAAEQADLAALHERRDQVDDLDAGLEDRGLGLEVDELRASRGGSATARCSPGIGGAAVHRLAEHVEDPAQRRGPDRHRDRRRRCRSPSCRAPRRRCCVMATARTWFWPMCCCTSATSRIGQRAGRVLERAARCRSPAGAPARTRRRAPGR